MALKFGILPAELKGMDENGLPIWDDRAVDEEYFTRYHQELLYNGISAKIPTSFQINQNTGMVLAVKPGAIFLEGYFAYDKESSNVVLEQANPDTSRIDRIVFRLDKPKRWMGIKVIKGAEGLLNLKAPELIRNEDIYDLGLATVSIKKGTTDIYAEDITDTRTDKQICGFVANYLGDVDFTDFFAQYEAEFSNWFKHIKGQLSEDSAGNLQNQIDGLTESKVEKVAYEKQMGEVNSSLTDLLIESASRLHGNIPVIVGVTAGTNKVSSVTFPKAFAKTPATVIITANTNTPAYVSYSVANKTATGFDIYYTVSSTMRLGFEWTAIL